MADPTTTARETPSGIPIKEGFSSKIAFALDPDISLWEKSVTPPSLDGGEPVPSTTMHNALYRTQRARTLVTIGNISGKCEYDPAVWDQIMSIINVEGSITVEWRDGSTLDLFGYLQKFEFSELTEGGEAEATYTIVVTNWDPVNNLEVGPNLTSVAGT